MLFENATTVGLFVSSILPLWSTSTLINHLTTNFANFFYKSSKKNVFFKRLWIPGRQFKNRKEHLCSRVLYRLARRPNSGLAKEAGTPPAFFKHNIREG